MGSKTSKSNSSSAEQLSQETIDELCTDTGFTEEELLNWHMNFYKDCPDGKLTLKQFEQQYAKIMGKPTQKTADYIRHMFGVYDQDKNQFIDFKEFVVALSAASVVNRLRLVETLFHVFDLDNDGKITKDEIAKMLHTLVDVTNSNHKQRRHHHGNNQQEQNKQINLQKRIDDAFNELNANDDDHITKDEFIEWYMKSGLISDVQSNEIDVTDASRIQEIGKKSRKLMKQSTNMKTNNDQDDNRHRFSQLVRHMSRMTEKKSQSADDDDDDDADDHREYNNQPTTVSTPSRSRNDGRVGIGRAVNRPTVRVTSNSDDTESQSSRENERWQHLYNSVLGQIRSQRVKEPPTGQENFHSWKREGEERLKSEYLKQNPNGQQNRSHLSTKNDVLPNSTTTITTTSYQSPPSPDIVTVRL